MSPYRPEQVIPQRLRPIVEDIPYWFVIGGHAVRCICPYRPTRHVDFGVREVRSLDGLVRELQETGETEILERNGDTVHLRWNAIDVSVFLLASLAPFTEDRRLSVEGILAPKRSTTPSCCARSPTSTTPIAKRPCPQKEYRTGAGSRISFSRAWGSSSCRHPSDWRSRMCAWM